MLALLLVATAAPATSAAGEVPPTPVEFGTNPAGAWAGSLSFDEANLQTKNVPLNVTIMDHGSFPVRASFTWYFTKDGPSGSCRGQLEPTLTWSVDDKSGLVTAQGTGQNPTFYSFQGQLDRATNTINGTVYHPPFPSTNQACGTFTLRAVSAANPPRPPQCKAEPPHHGPSPPNPGPTPPPRPSTNAHKNPAVWPAPAVFTQADAGSQAVVDAAGLKLACTGGNADATAACASAIAPAFARGKAWAFMAPNADATGATLKTVTVTLAAAVPLQLDVNESYSLTVNSTHAAVTAPTQWGAMHGLETFFQLRE